MPNRPERKIDISNIKHGIKSDRIRQLQESVKTQTQREKPESETLEWFDDRYAAILRGRNKLILQGKAEEAKAFYSQWKDEFDRKLREHPEIRKKYYDEPVGIDLATRTQLNRFGWISKIVEGNEDTVKLFNTALVALI